MKNKPEWWVLLVALLAMAAKLYCAATTFGTVDFVIFRQFGRFIAQEGVLPIYRADPWFTHPPIVGNYLGQTYEWSHGSNQLFAFFLRLPGILADFAVILLLLWVRRQTGRPPLWALLLLAASPVTFMISGYHGNFDSLIALGLMLVCAACLQQRALLAGVLLGLACQVKIIPLLLAPAFFFFWWHRGKGFTFAIGAAVTLLVGWSAPLIAVPEVFLRQVISYNSTWGWWGLTYLLNISGWPAVTGILAAEAPNPTQSIMLHALKAIIVIGTIVVAWRRRKVDAVELPATVAIVWALFLGLAPGFGFQYLAWVSPFLLFYSARWFGAYTACASVGLFVFYNTVSGGMPWRVGTGLIRLVGTWGPWLLLPWAIFIGMLIVSRGEFGLGGGKRPIDAAGDDTTPEAGTADTELSLADGLGSAEPRRSVG